MKMLRLVWLFVLCSFSATTFAQIEADPATWKYEVKKTGDNEYQLIFHLTVKQGWHIFALKPGGDGMQLPPSFTFNKQESVKLIGGITEKGKPITGPMDGVDGIVTFFKDNVDYIQKVKVAGNITITGKQKYQVCDYNHCLAPTRKPFSFEIKDATSTAVNDTTKSDTAHATAQTTTNTNNTNVPKESSGGGVATDKANAADKSISKGSLYLRGFLSGLLAVITPCVFAMLPMNVSFFLKRSKTRAKGIMTALQYSLSILLIFAIIGLLVSLLPRNAFNNLSTNWIVNMVFFTIFIVFGFSFLGAFELNLPSSWATKIDSKASTSNFVGIFFMALTLVIVSFSCTVPFIGGLLIMVQDSGTLGPLIGFVGFGTGLALPFTLFVLFPTLLNEFGKQGGWLNAVKVTFGFIELALALKFLSNADLAKGWRLLDREVFLSCWITLSFLLGIYLLGLIRFSHDSELPKNDWGLPFLKVPRLIFAICSLVFAFYLIPGMWGAPLNGMSALLPPPGTQDFIINTGGGNSSGGSTASSSNDVVKPVKYVNELRIYEPLFVTQNGIESFFDYEEALNASKILKKPVMLDFTGINCANCRKMESQVLSNPKVAAILKDKFILASLYSDYDKKPLPAKEQFYSQALQGQVETLGDLNEHIQASKFKSNSQPYYFFVDEKGNKLVEEGYQYDSDVAKFLAHINKVLENYNKTHL